MEKPQNSKLEEVIVISADKNNFDDVIKEQPKSLKSLEKIEKPEVEIEG